MPEMVDVPDWTWVADRKTKQVPTNLVDPVVFVGVAREPGLIRFMAVIGDGEDS